LEPIKWPPKAKFLHLLWEKPATHIAEELGCCQGTILIRAKDLGLPTPGFGYWQRKRLGLEMPISDAVTHLMAILDSQPPDEPASGPDSQRIRSPRRRRSERKKPEHIAWPSKFGLLQLLWTKPACQIACDLGCGYQAVLCRAKRLGLPVPGNAYWQKKRAGHEVKIPGHVVELMKQLESEGLRD
jgi:hypothetical protein